MESKLVIGIIDIVEDKLREFNIMIPDDDREDSTDPIVGYHYAELHDRIAEYLSGQGISDQPVKNNQTPRFDGHSTENRLKALYKEIDFLLNHAPIEDDCTDEENDMYSDMANLKCSIYDAGYGSD